VILEFVQKAGRKRKMEKKIPNESEGKQEQKFDAESRNFKNIFS
jgi:hypothetical protein